MALSMIVAVGLAAGCGGAGASHSGAGPVSSPAPAEQSPAADSRVLDPAPRGAVRITAAGFPAMITAGAGSIWVFAHRSTTAYRVDPATNRIVATVNYGDTPCTLASYGAGLVWNSNCGPNESSRGMSIGIDPQSDRVSRKIAGNDPVVGTGSLWVLDDTGKSVRRVDPQSGVVLAHIPTGVDQVPGGGALTIGGVGYGSVWLASDSAASLTRIATATDTVTAVIRLVGAKTEDQAFPSAAAQDTGYINGSTVAFAAGKAWYANPAGLFEVDARTNRARLIPLPMQPFTNWGDDTVVSGAGSIWVRTTNDQIDRVNPATGKVQGRYPAGSSGGGGDISVAFGSLWVANAGSDSVWREPIHGG